MVYKFSKVTVNFNIVQETAKSWLFHVKNEILNLSNALW